MRRKQFIISAILLILLAALVGYNYIYQGHREIATETVKFELTSNDLASSFYTNIKDAEAKYLNTTIIVSGNISEITKNNITLDDKVFCQFENDIKADGTIKIKGRVIGYDDLLEQVKMDQCIIQ